MPIQHAHRGNPVNNSLFLLVTAMALIALIPLFVAATMRLSQRTKLHTPSTSQTYLHQSVPTAPIQSVPTAPAIPINSRPLTPIPSPSPQTNRQQPVVYYGNQSQPSNHLTRFDSWRTGQEGEDAVMSRILAGLDAHWVVFRNLWLPGHHNGDIDLVLVGPGGIWAIEVKTYTGNYRVERGSWYKETSNGHWAKDKRGPGAQVRTNAATLCNYLKSQRITHKVGVNRLVVAAGTADITIQSSRTPVWTLERLSSELNSLNKLRWLSQEQVHTITRVLLNATNQSIN